MSFYRIAPLDTRARGLGKEKRTILSCGRNRAVHDNDGEQYKENGCVFEYRRLKYC